MVSCCQMSLFCPWRFKNQFTAQFTLLPYRLLPHPPSRRRFREALLNKTEHRPRTHHKNRLVHAARIHLVLLLVGSGHAFECRNVFHLFRRTFDDDCLFAMVVRHRASRISREVPSLARFSSRRKVNRIVHPHSPHRHHMRTIRRMNRRHPERPATTHLLSNPRP